MAEQQRRAPSPLAHGPDGECASCRDCPSCDGGSGVTPASYRVENRRGVLVVVCTRCDGSGTVCLNLVRGPR